MKKKLMFAIAAILLIACTTLTFAHTSNAATVSITAGATGNPSIVQSVGGAGAEGVPTTVKLKYSSGTDSPYTTVPPSWAPVKNQAGSISSGDVYYVDATNYAGDLRVTVYLTNTGSLAKDYTYLNMEVNVWTGSSGAWTQATPVDDTANATGYLTLDKGTLSFILQGSTHYCFSIEGGAFYCIDTTIDGTHDLSPQYYMDAVAF